MKYLLFLLFITGTIGSYAQHKLIIVNKKNNKPEEVSIAINPINAMEIAAVSNINNYYFSTNGGKSWTEKTMRSINGIWGDPMVHFDLNGNLYYAHLGKNPEKYFPTWIDKMVVQRIDIKYDSCFADAAIGFNANKIQDKEWLNTNHNGNVFLTWTEFDKYESRNPGDHSRIRFSMSDDKGLNWIKPIIISDVEGDCMDGDSTMEGATSCTDSRGNIYVCWSGINKIWFDKSTDGGKTFGRDKIIATHVEGWDIPVRHIFRANGMPFILCDASGTKFKNRIYMNWADTRNGDADIFIKYSDDGGETWSNDIRVNNDKIGNGAEQFSNNFCIDASTGNLYVVFYDKRNSPTGSFIDVYIAYSKDGGNTWENFRITPRPFAAPGKNVFFGDYIDIDAVNGNIMPAFTVTEQERFNVITTRLNLESVTDYHVAEDLQATILNDSLYMHVIVPKNKNYTLTITTNGRKTIYTRQSPADEQEYVMTARGFYEAKIRLKYGIKKKKLKVMNNSRKS
jgi:hypothetical protein